MKIEQNHSATLKKRQVISWISWLTVLAIYLFMPRNPTREWVGLILDLGITLIAIMEWFVVIESFSNKATRKDIVFHLFFAAYATFLFLHVEKHVEHFLLLSSFPLFYPECLVRYMHNKLNILN